uniref:Phage protein n=1 Tax=Bacillus phage KoopaTroopa TaxID=3234046 RepID=A0AB39C7A1_9CAUD
MVNIIHERFPEFGNATCEDKLLEEVFRAKVTFGKQVKVVVHPKYYKDCFLDSKNTIKLDAGGYATGVEIHLSESVDTYVLEFVEFGEKE